MRQSARVMQRLSEYKVWPLVRPCPSCGSMMSSSNIGNTSKVFGQDQGWLVCRNCGKRWVMRQDWRNELLRLFGVFVVWGFLPLVVLGLVTSSSRFATVLAFIWMLVTTVLIVRHLNRIEIEEADK